MTLFLIGPSSNYFDGNRKGFSMAAEALRKGGNTVIDPLEVLECYAGDWRMVYRALLDCESVAAMPGWEFDKWCYVCADVARVLGIPIIDSTTEQPIKNHGP